MKVNKLLVNVFEHMQNLKSNLRHEEHYPFVYANENFFIEL